MDNNLPIKPLILIVDDVEMNIEVLKIVIEEMGYEAVTALSGKEAGKRIKERLPQLILLDIKMPEMDGFQFCKQLKADAETKDIPVIFVSAADDAKDQKMATSVGAVDFITKPIKPYKVKIRVETHVKFAQMKRELEYQNRRLHAFVNEKTQKVSYEQQMAIAALTEMMMIGKTEEEIFHLDNVKSNARLLAQALNFMGTYENKISTEFIENIEYAAGLYEATPRMLSMLSKIYELDNENEAIQMVFDISQSYKEDFSKHSAGKGRNENKIPLSARIVAVCVYCDRMQMDFMEEVRKTKDDIDADTCFALALARLKEQTPDKFEPEIVDLFVNLEKQLKRHGDLIE